MGEQPRQRLLHEVVGCDLDRCDDGGEPPQPRVEPQEGRVVERPGYGLRVGHDSKDTDRRHGVTARS